MDKSLDQIREYIEHVLYDHEAAKLDLEQMDVEYKELSGALLFLGNSILEMYSYICEMADGKLDRQMSRQNPLLYPLKDLQSKLSHITWQTMQVAKGNFDIQIQYLGEFSDAFSIMVDQLKKRTEMIKRNAEMEKQILKTEKHILECELENQVNHYKSMVSMNQEIRAYQHDIKNHLLCLGSLIEDQNIEMAKEYLKDISKLVYHNERIVHTDNYILDALLSEKALIAKEKNIRFTMELRLKKELNIQPIDWCAIFGNALDNAIEACDKVKEDKRYIHISANCMGDLLKIKIENSMFGNLKDNKEFETTKNRKAYHGFGIKNIKKAVGNYDGIMEITTDNEIFIMEILLCNIISQVKIDGK